MTVASLIIINTGQLFYRRNFHICMKSLEFMQNHAITYKHM